MDALPSLFISLILETDGKLVSLKNLHRLFTGTCKIPPWFRLKQFVTFIEKQKC